MSDLNALINAPWSEALALLGVIVALYLFFRRRRRVRVTYAFIWAAVARRDARPWQRWLRLALSIAVACALVGAAALGLNDVSAQLTRDHPALVPDTPAEPDGPPEREPARRALTVLILDSSASMAARVDPSAIAPALREPLPDERGPGAPAAPTRFTLARRMVRAVARALGPGEALIVVSDTPGGAAVAVRVREPIDPVDDLTALPPIEFAWPRSLPTTPAPPTFRADWRAIAGATMRAIEATLRGCLVADQPLPTSIVGAILSDGQLLADYGADRGVLPRLPEPFAVDGTALDGAPWKLDLGQVIAALEGQPAIDGMPLTIAFVPAAFGAAERPLNWAIADAQLSADSTVIEVTVARHGGPAAPAAVAVRLEAGGDGASTVVTLQADESTTVTLPVPTTPAAADSRAVSDAVRQFATEGARTPGGAWHATVQLVSRTASGPPDGFAFDDSFGVFLPLRRAPRLDVRGRTDRRSSAVLLEVLRALEALGVVRLEPVDADDDADPPVLLLLGDGGSLDPREASADELAAERAEVDRAVANALGVIRFGQPAAAELADAERAANQGVTGQSIAPGNLVRYELDQDVVALGDLAQYPAAIREAALFSDKGGRTALLTTPAGAIAVFDPADAGIGDHHGGGDGGRMRRPARIWFGFELSVTSTSMLWQPQVGAVLLKRCIEALTPRREAPVRGLARVGEPVALMLSRESGSAAALPEVDPMGLTWHAPRALRAGAAPDVWTVPFDDTAPQAPAAGAPGIAWLAARRLDPVTLQPRDDDDQRWRWPVSIVAFDREESLGASCAGGGVSLRPDIILPRWSRAPEPRGAEPTAPPDVPAVDPPSTDRSTLVLVLLAIALGLACIEFALFRWRVTE